MDTTIRLLNISDPLVALIESYREHPYFPSLSANWVPKITVSHTAIRVVLLNRITYQIRKTCRVRFANIKIKFNVYANGDVTFYGVDLPSAQVPTHSVRVKIFQQFKDAFPFMRVTGVPLNNFDIHQPITGDLNET